MRPGAPAARAEGVSGVEPSEGTTMSRRTVRVWGWTLVAAGVLGFPADAPARGFGGGFHGGGFHGGGFHGGGFHPGGFHAGGFHPGGFRGFGGVPVGGFHHYGGIGGGVPRW